MQKTEVKDTDLTAVLAAASDGKRPSKMSRMKYASFVVGTSWGQRSEALAKAASETACSAWSFMLLAGGRVSFGSRDETKEERGGEEERGVVREAGERTRRSRSIRRRLRIAPFVSRGWTVGGMACRPVRCRKLCG